MSNNQSIDSYLRNREADIRKAEFIEWADEVEQSVIDHERAVAQNQPLPMSQESYADAIRVLCRNGRR